MSIENLGINNYDSSKDFNESIEKQDNVVELDMSMEDFKNLEILRNRIDNIKSSTYSKRKEFEELTIKFLEKIEDIFDEGEIQQIASIALLKGEGISETADEFDFTDDRFSVLEFVKSFE